MAKTIDKLTALAVSRLGPGLHSDGGNLYLQVQGGSRTWQFQYTRHGKTTSMGLGPTHTLGLQEARQRALECRQLLLRGIDPCEDREQRRAAALAAQRKLVPLKECVRELVASNKAGWRSKDYVVQFEKQLATHIYPTLGDLPVSEIDTALVLKAFEGIWTKIPDTASRLRQRVEAALDLAIAREYRAAPNPARWKGHLENLLPKPTKLAQVEHFAALPWREVGSFMAALRRIESSAGYALQLLVLTAARTGETRNALWSEFDLAKALWTIPPTRSKSGREHRVPLNQPALDLLKRLHENRRGEYVFAGRDPQQPFNHRGMAELVALQLKRSDISIHGFRSCFRDWCADHGIAREVAEAALGHATGDAVERAYRRSDLYARRRETMELWGRFCDSIQPSESNVTPLHAAL